MRGKPSPSGITIFVLASECGIIYNYILYQGSSTELDQNKLKIFGFGASVVLFLVQTLKEKTHILFFDNFFPPIHYLNDFIISAYMQLEQSEQIVL